MEKVILDAELRAKLHGKSGSVDVCDETGAVVGHYLSATEYQRLMDTMFPPITPEEREEALQEIREGRGFSTANILARVEQLKRKWEACK